MRNRLVAVAVVGIAVLSGVAVAQDYPTRPVRIISSFPPGGGVDAVARTVAPHLQKRLGQPVIVENKAGAAGTIGTDYVAKSPKDGYTLLIGAPGGLSAAPALYKSLPYDPIKDLAPVTMGVKMSNLLVVHPSFKATTVAELIAMAKTEPGKLAYGSGGVGTTLHLSGELFKSMAGVDILHVPYKGSGPVLADLVSGQLMMAFTDPAALEHVKAGRLRLLGQTSGVRLPQLADVPTIAESGVPGYDALNWFAFMLPAGTPEAIVTRLNSELVAILKSPEVVARLDAMAMQSSPMTPREMAAFLLEDTKRWGELAAKVGLKAE